MPKRRDTSKDIEVESAAKAPAVKPAKVPADRQQKPVVAAPAIVTPAFEIKERHVVVGDLHLRRTDPLGVIEPDGLNTRLKDKLQALAYAVQHAVEHRATHLDLLGDVYEAVNPPERLKELFWQTLMPAIKRDVQVTILIGNHDTTGELYNFAGDTLIAPANIRIVKTGFASGSTCTTFYLPYMHKEQVIEAYEALRALHGVPRVIFGHWEIAGAALAPDNSQIREGIDRQVFADVPIVLLGHIHKHQVFRPGFAYVGSSVRCDFGEVNNQKVFAVLDIGQQELVVQYIEIPQRPMFQLLVAENDPGNLYLAEKIPANIKEPGVLLKFVFEGSEEWVNALDKPKFKKRFPQALRIITEDHKLDMDRPAVELVATNMEDRVHDHVKLKSKGKDYLDAGLLIAREAQEVEL